MLFFVILAGSYLIKRVLALFCPISFCGTHVILKTSQMSYIFSSFQQLICFENITFYTFYTFFENL